MHSYTNRQVYSYKLYIHSYRQIYTHNTHIHTLYTQTHTHTHSHTDTHIHTHTHTHTHTTYAHKHTHTNTHTITHVYMFFTHMVECSTKVVVSFLRISFYSSIFKDEGKSLKRNNRTTTLN